MLPINVEPKISNEKKSVSKSTAAPKALVIQWLIYIFATIVHSPKSKKKKSNK